MVRRKMLRLLGLCSFGLLTGRGVLASNNEQDPAVSLPKDDSIFVFIRHGGQTYNLGFNLTANAKLNNQRLKWLFKSNTRFLWALDRITGLDVTEAHYPREIKEEWPEEVKSFWIKDQRDLKKTILQDIAKLQVQQ